MNLNLYICTKEATPFLLKYDNASKRVSVRPSPVTWRASVLLQLIPPPPRPVRLVVRYLLLQDTETESYVNNAEPWKQGVGGLVAPRTFAARFFVTRCVDDE